VSSTGDNETATDRPLNTHGISMGPVELDVPLPGASRPLSATEHRLLELQVGASFVLTQGAQSHHDRYGRRCVTDEVSRLRSWAQTKGLRLCVRKLDGNSHRIWRVA
jgi:hypothetical protein